MNNYGFSFGFTFPWFEVVAGFAWIGLLYFAIKERSCWLFLAVMGGGLNIGERIISGYVTDYWKIPGIPLYNNINDWLIFIGIGAYLWKKSK